ncbi:MAG: hypothetical protein ABIQ90_15045 [Polaromonas sp.]
MALVLPVDPLIPVEPLPVPEGLVVEGLVDDDEPGFIIPSSVLLLQPPNASAAVSAIATVQAVLIVDAYISVSFLKNWSG